MSEETLQLEAELKAITDTMVRYSLVGTNLQVIYTEGKAEITNVWHNEALHKQYDILQERATQISKRLAEVTRREHERK